MLLPNKHIFICFTIDKTCSTDLLSSFFLLFLLLLIKYQYLTPDWSFSRFYPPVSLLHEPLVQWGFWSNCLTMGQNFSLERSENLILNVAGTLFRITKKKTQSLWWILCTCGPVTPDESHWVLWAELSNWASLGLVGPRCRNHKRVAETRYIYNHFHLF